MAVINTGIDNNQSVVRRGNNANTDITNTGPGDNGMQHASHAAAGTVGNQNDGIVSRDSDNPLGNRINDHSINYQLSYQNVRIQNPSGYDIHGQPIQALTTRSHNPIATLAGNTVIDDEAKAGYGDQGKMWWTRGVAPSGIAHATPDA